MRIQPLHRIFAAAIFVAAAGSHAKSSFAQAPVVIGDLSVPRGQGATLATTVSFISGNRLRFTSNPGGGLPPGVTMTPTYLEPGSNRLSLHFEAASGAQLATNVPVDIYADGSSAPAYRVKLSVVAAMAQVCGAATLNPLDQSSQAVVAQGAAPGCQIEVWAGDNGGLVPIASKAASVGTTVLRIPIPHRLTPGQTVRVLQKSGATTTFLSGSTIVENNYATNRYDSERSGWNPNETTLTVNNVRNLRLVCQKKVGGSLRAQPLYLQDVTIGGTKHNVVFVVTDSDTNATTQDTEGSNLVYAFDADSCAPNDQGLWVGAGGNPSPRSLIDSASGEQPVSATDLANALQALPNSPVLESPACAFMLGVTATPVVDRTTNTLYVIALVQKNANMFYELHALDIATGKDQPGSPAKIDGSVQFRGVNFEPALEASRPGLLLDNGVVYVAFGSRCDSGDFYGWVLAYDATVPGSTSFLHPVGVFNTAPVTGGRSSVWQCGLGLAADGKGTIYLATGNGVFDPTQSAYEDTLLGLELPSKPGSLEMQVANFFTPWDWGDGSSYAAAGNDNELGAGGPTLMSPYNPSAFTVPGISNHYILVGGKVAKSYFIDRELFDTGVNTGNPNRCAGGCQSDDPNLVVQTNTFGQGSVAAPAYYTGPHGVRVFYGLNYSPLTAFDVGVLSPPMTVAEASTDNAPETAPIPTVSSNGALPSTGVVWAIFPGTGLANPDATAPQTLSLHAYDANDLRTNLLAGPNGQTGLDAGTWESTVASFGNSFETPTVIHGKVFTGSEDQLRIYAPLRRCRPVVVHNVVVWFCPELPIRHLILQRLQDQKWITVADHASKLRDGSSYLFDYPPNQTARYRVCTKEQPTDCESEISVDVKGKPERIPDNLKGKCGVAGKPPCFLLKSWPVQASELMEGKKDKK